MGLVPQGVGYGGDDFIGWLVRRVHITCSHSLMLLIVTCCFVRPWWGDIWVCLLRCPSIYWCISYGHHMLARMGSHLRKVFGTFPLFSFDLLLGLYWHICGGSILLFWWSQSLFIPWWAHTLRLVLYLSHYMELSYPWFELPIHMVDLTLYPWHICLHKNNIIFMEGAQKEYYIVVQACLMETLYSVEIPAFTTKPHSSSNAIATLHKDVFG